MAGNRKSSKARKGSNEANSHDNKSKSASLNALDTSTSPPTPANEVDLSMANATYGSISKSDASMRDASLEAPEVTASDLTMHDATASLEVTKSDFSMEDTSLRTPEFSKMNKSFGDASYRDSDYSRTDTSMADLTSSLERTVMDHSMHDATPRLEASRTDTSMLDASDRDPEQTSSDATMADGTLQSLTDISMEDAGSLLSLSTLRSGSTQHPRHQPSHSRQTAERTDSLSRALAAVKVEHSPAPSAPSPTESSTKRSLSSISSNPSTIVLNTRPSPPPELSSIQALMESSSPPTHYIPVWILENGTMKTGQPITSLSVRQQFTSGNNNDSNTGDITVIPLGEMNDHSRPVLQPAASISSQVNAQSADEGATTKATANEVATDQETDDELAINKDNLSMDNSPKEDYQGIFGPILIFNMIGENGKSDHSTYGLKNVGYTLGLTHEQHRAWASQPYDMNWMQIANAPDDILDKAIFRSKIKLDHMVKNGALKIGDEVYHIGQVTSGGGATVEKFGRVVSVNVKSEPDFALYVNGTQQGSILQECKGPVSLLEALSKLEPKTDMPSTAISWFSVNVRRNGSDLGTLQHNRLKYHRFELEQKAWVAWTSKKTKAAEKEAKGGKKVAEVDNA